MSKRTTVVDVAKRAGVSTAVVSYVVNDGPRKVSEKSRRRVEKAIFELGYRPNAIASALMKGHSNLIGLLVPNTSNPFFAELAHALETEARKRGLLMMLGNTSHDPNIEREYEQALMDLNARAIFISTVNKSQNINFMGTKRIYLHSTPTSETDDSLQDPYVRFDDFDGGYKAAQYLISLGYENIHCLAGANDFGPFAERRKGWLAALEEAGLSKGTKMYMVPDDRIEAVQEISKILSIKEQPDAFFATSDEQALAAIRAAKELGISVPNDLAVFGFDGIREALHGNIRLTTMVVPLKELALEAFNALDILDNGQDIRNVILPVQLKSGATCVDKKQSL